MRRSARNIAIVTTAVAVAVSSAAWAAWTADGTGTANAQAGSVAVLESVISSPQGAKLHPGGYGSLSLTLKNPNDFSVQVIRVESGGTITADPAHALAGCGITGVVFPADGQRKLTVSWHLGPGATISEQIPRAVRMTNESDNGCQGATFTVPVFLTAFSE